MMVVLASDRTHAHPCVLMYMPLIVIIAIHARWIRPQKVWPVIPCISSFCRPHKKHT